MSADGVENNTSGGGGVSVEQGASWELSLLTVPCYDLQCSPHQTQAHLLPSRTLHLYPFALLCNVSSAFVKLKPSFPRQHRLYGWNFSKKASKILSFFCDPACHKGRDITPLLRTWKVSLKGPQLIKGIWDSLGFYKGPLEFPKDLLGFQRAFWVSKGSSGF